MNAVSVPRAGKEVPDSPVTPASGASLDGAARDAYLDSTREGILFGGLAWGSRVEVFRMNGEKIALLAERNGQALWPRSSGADFRRPYFIRVRSVSGKMATWLLPRLE